MAVVSPCCKTLRHRRKTGGTLFFINWLQDEVSTEINKLTRVKISSYLKGFPWSEWTCQL